MDQLRFTGFGPDAAPPRAYSKTKGYNHVSQSKQGHLQPRTAPQTGKMDYGVGPADPRLRPGSVTCLCSMCGEYFNGPAAFDKHLRGTGATLHCWTVLQMVEHGMSKNARDLWITEAYAGPAHR